VDEVGENTSQKQDGNIGEGTLVVVRGNRPQEKNHTVNATLLYLDSLPLMVRPSCVPLLSPQNR
jgi:hypothetical protein